MKTKKRILATAVLTTAAVMQLMTTAMAKETSNSATDDRNKDTYSNSAHTTFGVIETDKDVSGQVSYEVPLFVTMAATPGRNHMLLPTEDQYYIENTSGDIKDKDKVIKTNPIGVVGLSVEGLMSNTWEIRKKEFTMDDTDAADNHKMTFKLGDIAFGESDTDTLKGQFNKVFFDDSVNAAGEQETTHWNKQKVSNQFINVGGYTHKVPNPNYNAGVDDESKKEIEKVDNALVKIGRGNDRMNVKLDATIANLTAAQRKNNGNTATTGLFKVKYVLAALDDNGQPKLAAVYAGDNWIDAGYATERK